MSDGPELIWDGESHFVLDEDKMFEAFGPRFSWEVFYGILSLVHWQTAVSVADLPDLMSTIGIEASQYDIDRAVASSDAVIKVIGGVIFPVEMDFIKKIGEANIDHAAYLLGQKSPPRAYN